MANTAAQQTRKRPVRDIVETRAIKMEGGAGTSPGVNISPGSDDDGWIIPEPVQLSGGTRVQLYKDGEALHAAYEAIRQARHRICLEAYIFASDETGNAFAELLAQKAQEGVRVYVIYDSLGSLGVEGLWRPRPKIFSMMKRAGVRVQEFHPIRPWEGRFSWRPILRDHRKLLVIDDEIAGLGGLNVGREYAGSWIVPSDGSPADFWRDNAMGIVGPGARLLLESFSAMWRYCIGGGRLRRAEFHHPIGDGELGVLASVPTLSSPLRVLLRELLRGATRSIDLTMAYFAPPDELIETLCRASRRGVRVRLVLPARCDVQLLIIAARSFYETLLSAGVEIYERQHVVLHTKSLVIDDELTVLGSTNLDYRSTEYNCELSVLVRSKEYGEQMRALFEHDMAYSKRVSLNQWRRRPMLDRFGQWAVKRTRYWL